jgi:hypothetical protein
MGRTCIMCGEDERMYEKFLLGSQVVRKLCVCVCV